MSFKARVTTQLRSDDDDYFSVWGPVLRRQNRSPFGETAYWQSEYLLGKHSPPPPPCPPACFNGQFLFLSDSGPSFNLSGRPQVTIWPRRLPQQKQKHSGAEAVLVNEQAPFSPQGDLYLQNPMVLL